MAERGVPTQAIADVLGQSEASITNRYMHLRPEALKRVFETMREAGG